MLDTIERKAEISVARGCAFAALAVGLLFIGVSPAGLAIAFLVSGALAIAIAVILLAKGGMAARRPHKRTEVWGMLKPDERPQAAIAQVLIARVLRELYLRFAMQAASAGLAFGVASLVCRVLGI